jgi:formylmethanofuran dehydrogenase subunit E
MTGKKPARRGLLRLYKYYVEGTSMQDFKCFACEGVFPAHKRYDVDGKTLCPACAERFTVVCIKCGERFLFEANMNGVYPVCPKCWTGHV